jgi:pantoate--beta-alanine ligase
MKLLRSVSEVRDAVKRARSEGKTIGLVPTMGALHEGHLTLIRQARARCGFVVVSVFVNPTQFGPREDFARYPRSLDEDTRKCADAGVDVVFAPHADEVYPEGFDTWVEVKGLTEVLEGESRPGHFRGVTTVCAKLFNITQPDYAYFGMKDYQQLKVIQKMVSDLNLPLEIMPCETVREPDGLAMSSRNAYLGPEERRAALALVRSLRQAREAFDSGEREAAAIQVQVEHLIRAEPRASIDYVAIVDAEDLRPISRLDRPVVVLLAVRIGTTRLIDNLVLDAKAD